MQKVVLDEPRTLGEAVLEVKLLRQENEFLKRQLETAQMFQAKMGLTLNKITISELFEKKLLECSARELSRTRMICYDYAKYYFLRWSNENGLEYADEVTTDHAYMFWEWFKITPGKQNKILSEASRAHVWAAIKATFQYAKERNSVISNPFKFKPIPLKAVSDWWDDEYFYSLIDAIRAHIKTSLVFKYETIVRCIYTTGLRVGLFLGVKHENVMIEGDRLFITTKMKIPKSSRIQDFTCEIMNKKAKEMFLSLYDPKKKGYVFCNNPTNYAITFRKSLKGEKARERNKARIGICEKAGIPYKSPHKAKHGFVTKMLEKGYSAVQICKMTGNLNPVVIEKVYNHVKLTNFCNKVKADIEDL